MIRSCRVCPPSHPALPHLFVIQCLCKKNTDPLFAKQIGKWLYFYTRSDGIATKSRPKWRIWPYKSYWSALDQSSSCTKKNCQFILFRYSSPSYSEWVLQKHKRTKPSIPVLGVRSIQRESKRERVREVQTNAIIKCSLTCGVCTPNWYIYSELTIRVCTCTKASTNPNNSHLKRTAQQPFHPEYAAILTFRRYVVFMFPAQFPRSSRRHFDTKTLISPFAKSSFIFILLSA